MTNGREILAYVLAHLGGYVVGLVLHQVVLIPLLVQMDMMRSPMAMTAIFFLVNAIIQAAVFLAFLAIRGRRVAP